MIIVITGGAGFIGLNVARKLLQTVDCTIRIVDNFSNSTRERVDQVLGVRRVEVIEADICDVEIAMSAVAGAEAVIHLAAQTGIPGSLDNPRADLHSNVVGTFNYLEAARQAGAVRFVFSSSGAVLGNAPPPQREDRPSRPLSPYGASKAAAEAYCSAYRCSWGMETTVLRFANVYGQFAWNKGSVIAAFAKQAIAGLPLIVNGNGEQTRDFVNAEDLSEVVIAGLQGRLVAADGAPMNVATGIGTPILVLAKAVAAHFVSRGRKCEIEFAPARIGDVLFASSDPALLQHVAPDIKLREVTSGLGPTLDWFIDQYQG